jgi:hypothetical protein
MSTPVSRQPSTPLDVAMAATAALDQVEAELATLRAHIADLATADTPGDARGAARSARIVAALTAGVADQLRDLGARQSLV